MKRTSPIRYFYMFLLLLFLYLPILCVVLYSFNLSKSGAAWTGFTLKWYQELWDNTKIRQAFWVSLRVAGLTAFFSSILGTAAAIGVNSLNKKAKSFISALIYLPLIIPEIILGIALLMLLAATPMPFGIMSLVIGHCTFCIPYVFIMVNIRLRSIGKDVVEAAYDLGAGGFQVLATVILPLILPGILSGALLSVAMSMDDVVISTFVSGPTSLTLPVHIFSMMKLGVTPTINALCTVILVFTFTCVGLLQFYFSKK